MGGDSAERTRRHTRAWVRAIRLVVFLVLGLAIARYVRDRPRDEPAGLLQSLRAGQITIDRFVRAERAAAPAMFDRTLLESNERALKQSFPESTFSDVSLAGVTDGDGFMRAYLTYQGSLQLQGESVATRVQMAIYYHAAGMAVIAAACTAGEKECLKIEPLLADAEQRLRRRMAASDLDAVLPDAKTCATETIPVPNTFRQSQVRVCVYAPGMQLSLTRFDAASTIESIVADRSAIH